MNDFYNYDEYLYHVFCALTKCSNCKFAIGGVEITDTKELFDHIRKYDEVYKLDAINKLLSKYVDSHLDKECINALHIKQSLQTYKTVKDIEKEIATIKDSQQTTADIVNLFTDIDKNRTNTDEEIKKVNNRLDKLEASIGQILSLLQKS